jgi:hypothetical protein
MHHIALFRPEQYHCYHEETFQYDLVLHVLLLYIDRLCHQVSYCRYYNTFSCSYVTCQHKTIVRIRMLTYINCLEIFGGHFFPVICSTKF